MKKLYTFSFSKNSKFLFRKGEAENLPAEAKEEETPSSSKESFVSENKTDLPKEEKENTKSLKHPQGKKMKSLMWEVKNKVGRMVTSTSRDLDGTGDAVIDFSHRLFAFKKERLNYLLKKISKRSSFIKEEERLVSAEGKHGWAKRGTLENEIQQIEKDQKEVHLLKRKFAKDENLYKDLFEVENTLAKQLDRLYQIQSKSFQNKVFSQLPQGELKIMRLKKLMNTRYRLEESLFEIQNYINILSEKGKKLNKGLFEAQKNIQKKAREYEEAIAHRYHRGSPDKEKIMEFLMMTGIKLEGRFLKRIEFISQNNLEKLKEKPDYYKKMKDMVYISNILGKTQDHLYSAQEDQESVKNLINKPKNATSENIGKQVAQLKNIQKIFETRKKELLEG